MLRFTGRHHHEMGEADADLLRATRAQICLAGLEGVDEYDFELVVVVGQPSSAQSSSRITTTNAAATSA
jgi:hypothetical protein